MCCRQSGLINSAPILPCLTVRCAQEQSGVSGRFTQTYLVSALNAWICKVKYLDLRFAWLELRIQLVWINANKEMLFNHAVFFFFFFEGCIIYPPNTQRSSYECQSEKETKNSWNLYLFHFLFTDLVFICWKTSFKAIYVVIFKNLVKWT